ncbi:hypothetical protein H311_01171, partial [Anncaliia algerae PRA109]
LVKFNNEEMISFLFCNRFLKQEYKCLFCNEFMLLKTYDKKKGTKCWRCFNRLCDKYLNRVSLLKDSFFENFNVPVIYVFEILIRWFNGVTRQSIYNDLRIDHKTINKVINSFLERCGSFDFTEDKLGGCSSIVQIGETMLNYKCKSLRRRSPLNKKDALVIFEFREKITRAFAVVILNKKKSATLPIICNNVLNGNTIYTDEHKSYSELNQKGFVHDTVCHKFNFINKLSGANTQAVESFNNLIKWHIKQRKGIRTGLRQCFLNEICWLFNNKESRFERILNLIKV